MKKLLSELADWIYRKRCYICSKSYENRKLCSKCYEKIEFLPACVSRIVSSTNVYCACEYKAEIQKIIRGLKYHKKRELAYFQAKVMYDYWQRLNKSDDFLVIPIPLSKEREKERSYNHMVLVAQEFCALTGYELNTTLVSRIKNTKPQYKLTRKERMKNLDSAFKINIESYNDKPLLILDDICTTGATFESVIEQLKKHNITKITCFATSTPLGGAK